MPLTRTRSSSDAVVSALDGGRAPRTTRVLNEAGVCHEPASVWLVPGWTCLPSMLALVLSLLAQAQPQTPRCIDYELLCFTWSQSGECEGQTTSS